MAASNRLALRAEVLRSVKVAGHSIEMGVLQDGTPFLSSHGLSKACGISISSLAGWGEFTPKLGDGKGAGKVAELLAVQGYQDERLFTRVLDNNKEVTISAYPETVCMAFLEYYAFEAKEEAALQNFRVLGRSQIRNFIYEATGYEPHQKQSSSWQNHHELLPVITNLKSDSGNNPNPVIGISEAIYEISKALPEEQAKLVLLFAEFLQQRFLFSPRQPLLSRTELRSRQSFSHISSLDTVKQLREEARY